MLEAKGILEGRSGVAEGVAYKWNTLPGKHDKLDCHAMAYAAAGYEGVLTVDADADTGAQPSRGGGSGRNRRKVYHG